METPVSVCQDCGRTWEEDQLDEIEKHSMRVGAGEIVPSGQCPKCGALCHEERPPVLVVIDQGVLEDVVNLPPGIEYELIDFDLLLGGDNPAEYWNRLSTHAKNHIEKTRPDGFRRINENIAAWKGV